ncbi:MAG: TetR family transcriptional regulator, partial [Actinophytocola sp.]|nr:TetR family transcriptional regulator [Actinophytocola sp.]
LQLTVLSWLGLSLPGSVASEPAAGGQDEERPRLRLLRRRIIEQYGQPFDAILTSDDARATLRPDIDADTALAQLVGPLIFNRLVTEQPIDEAFCARIVDDFLAANTHDRNQIVNR